MYKVFPQKKEKPDHRLFSVPVKEIPGVELYLKQKRKLNINKNILLVKLKAAFNIIKIISNLIHTAYLIYTKVFKSVKNSMAKWLYVISIISNFNVIYYRYKRRFGHVCWM